VPEKVYVALSRGGGGGCAAVPEKKEAATRRRRSSGIWGGGGLDTADLAPLRRRGRRHLLARRAGEEGPAGSGVWPPLRARTCCAAPEKKVRRDRGGAAPAGSGGGSGRDRGGIPGRIVVGVRAGRGGHGLGVEAPGREARWFRSVGPSAPCLI
jgi:hypothetical protein